MIKAYTYLIGWSKLNLWYYGVRYKKGCAVDDLFVSYFTSSKVVHSLMFIHGLPDVKQIRKTFLSIKQALLWEQKVLRRIKVLKNEKWLNQNISGAINFTPVIRNIMSERKRGRVWLIKDNKKTLVVKELVEPLLLEGYTKWKPNHYGNKNGMFGKKHKEETKQKIGLLNSKSTLTEKGRTKKSKYMSKNNPMHNLEIKKKHKEKMQQLRSASKKVNYQGQIFESLKQANLKYPEQKYSTLAYKCKHKKDGWSYVQPSS